MGKASRGKMTGLTREGRIKRAEEKREREKQERHKRRVVALRSLGILIREQKRKEKGVAHKHE